MSDGTRSAGGGAGDITHCEWCGAEYEAPEGSQPSSEPAPSPAVVSAPVAPPSRVPADGETHCEWCGAEYPVPGEGG